MTDNTEFHPERLDVWTDTVEFAVERDRTVAYALATNDPIAAHRDGTLAPPVFDLYQQAIAAPTIRARRTPEENPE